jgi:hypothetical protein
MPISCPLYEEDQNNLLPRNENSYSCSLTNFNLLDGSGNLSMYESTVPFDIQGDIKEGTISSPAEKSLENPIQRRMFP